jgi:hypothetical protein
LIEKIAQRENFKQVLKSYSFLGNITEDILYDTYREVIPKIGRSGVPRSNMTFEQREMIRDFRILYLEE